MLTDYNDEIKTVASFWGDKMPMMLMEECGELIQALSKRERNHTLETEINVIEEIADVLISIGAVMEHYGISDDEVKHRICNKLDRQY